MVVLGKLSFNFGCLNAWCMLTRRNGCRKFFFYFGDLYPIFQSAKPKLYAKISGYVCGSVSVKAIFMNYASSILGYCRLVGVAVSQPGDHHPLPAVLVHSNSSSSMWPTPSLEWAELHHMLHPLLHPPWLKLHPLQLRVVVYKVCTSSSYHIAEIFCETKNSLMRADGEIGKISPGKNFRLYSVIFL